MLKIGSLKLKSNIILAPLAGISDSSFRLINRRFGAQFTFVEMINARAISYKSKKTKKMLGIDPSDRPIGIQLLGCEIPYILKAIEVLEKYTYDCLDFNIACPVKKVCRRGEGVALMKEPQKLKKILKEIVKHARQPVTVKLRTGWSQSNRNATQIAQLAQDCGIQAIFIHGRDKVQLYSGSVEYEAIAAVKKKVSIPVIGSGDIWSAQHAKRMFDETGCDGVLVARGALGNPWIFQEIKSYLKSKKVSQRPSLDKIIKTLLEHTELALTEHGEKNGIRIMRKFVGWYLKGQKFIKPLRQKVHTIKSKDELLTLLKTLSP